MSATTNRRFMELYRNGVIFDDKSTAIAAVNTSNFLNTIKDGELVAIRFYAWYKSGTNNLYEEVAAPSSTTGWSLKPTISVEPSGKTTKAYASGDMILVSSSSDGKYNLYSATGTVNTGVTIEVATGNNLSLVTSGDFYSINMLLALAYVDGSTKKLSFFEDEETIGKLVFNQVITSADGSIDLTKTSSGYDLSVKTGTTLLKGSNGTINVNIDNMSLKQDSNDSNKIKVNIDNNTLIQDTTTGVISVNASNAGVYGETGNAVIVTEHQTSGVTDGKTVKLVIDPSDKVLSQSTVVTSPSSGGLIANLEMVKFTTVDYDTTTSLPSNVRERYRLKGKGSATSASSYLGDYIDVYKDSSLYSVYLGHVDDTLTSSTDPTVISGTGDTALCFIYVVTGASSTYTLVAVNVESFLQETEFSDGLSVSNHVVSVNLKTNGGLEFDNGQIKVSKASTSVIGGIRTNYTTANKNYAVSVDSNGDAYVNVPWTAANNASFDIKTKVGSASAVTVGGTTADASANSSVTFIQGSNITLTSDTTNNTITIDATDTTYTTGTGTDVSGADTTAKVWTGAVLKGAIESYGYTTNTGTVTSVSAGTGLQTDITNNDPITTTGTISLKSATTSAIGGIKVGSVLASASSAITTDTAPTSSNGYKRYALLKDSNDLGYVCVPNGIVATYAVASSGGSPISGLDNLIVYNNAGELTVTNVWDCGTY